MKTNFAMMDMLRMQDFTYLLPDERIAKLPLEKRDDAKLLVWKNSAITHSSFSQLSDFLDTNSILFFNDTRVIPARLEFRKPTGAAIEVLLLNPIDPNLPQLSMSSTSRCRWECMLGNLKRWNDDQILTHEVEGIVLHAKLISRKQNIVEFSWNPPSLTFAEILERIGETPLPPYLQRSATQLDKSRYQTVYAHYDGAVAAPTAGLHFTDELMKSLEARGIKKDFLTLHVSAGTFLPVKTDNPLDHKMHEERIVITKQNILNLMSGKKVVAVGTTSMRTLESLYWYGCLLKQNPIADFDITQELPYSNEVHPISLSESLKQVLKRMGDQDEIGGRTSIFIRPGYTFHACAALITNFHQPGSTLLLLVAAFVGPRWKIIYQQAMQRDYRFLSYGDSSLLYPSKI